VILELHYILPFDTFPSNNAIASIDVNTLLSIKRDSFSIEFDVSPVLDSVVKQSQSGGRKHIAIRPQNLSLTSENGIYRIMINSINFRKENDQLILNNCEGYLLAKHQ